MWATMASEMRLSFWVVLKTQRLFSSIGSTTAGVPTGASIGTLASATNCSTAIALGEPGGPMMASTLFSLMRRLTRATDCVTSEASSTTMYSTSTPPIFFGSRAAVLRCGMPTTAVGPVEEAMTPTFICACAANAPAAMQQEGQALANLERGDWQHGQLLKAATKKPQFSRASATYGLCREPPGSARFDTARPSPSEVAHEYRATPCHRRNSPRRRRRHPVRPGQRSHPHPGRPC